jgi:hypothetical protein
MAARTPSATITPPTVISRFTRSSCKSVFRKVLFERDQLDGDPLVLIKMATNESFLLGSWLCRERERHPRLAGHSAKGRVTADHFTSGGYVDTAHRAGRLQSSLAPSVERVLDHPGLAMVNPLCVTALRPSTRSSFTPLETLTKHPSQSAHSRREILFTPFVTKFGYLWLHAEAPTRFRGARGSSEIRYRSQSARAEEGEPSGRANLCARQIVTPLRERRTMPPRMVTVPKQKSCTAVAAITPTLCG